MNSRGFGAEFPAKFMKILITFAMTVDTTRVRNHAVKIVFAGASKFDADVAPLEEIQG